MTIENNGLDDTGLVQQKTVLEAFEDGTGVDAILAEVGCIVEGFSHDMGTAASRKRTASLSAKISKVKTRVDGIGKDLVSGWKSQAKVIDANRKRFREDMDTLRDEARLPLKEWEDEQARIEAEKEAKIESDKLAALIESDHDIAILLNEKRDDDIAAAIILAAQATEERKRVEREAMERAATERAERQLIEQREQLERDKAAAAKAQETAKAAAEQAAEQAAKQAQQVALQAAKDVETANAARIEAEAKAKVDAEAAAERARLAEMARQELLLRQEQEAVQAREANKRHVGAIRKAAKESLMAVGLDEAMAKKVVIAISNADIANVFIKY